MRSTSGNLLPKSSGGGIISMFCPICKAEYRPMSTAAHPTSTGIKFAKNDNVSIENEMLLHERSVEVEYEFFSHSSEKVSAQVALPEVINGFDKS